CVAVVTCLSPSYSTPSYLHSFPTRRSSDLGDATADLDSLAYSRLTQCLCIGVNCKELNTFNAFTHHMLYGVTAAATDADDFNHRSEEHTSELQSRENLVCRLLLEKKKYIFL